MSTTHTISKSWHDAGWLYEQLAFASSGDAIVLTQDAVLAAHSPITLASFVAKCGAQNVHVYLLADDARLRGVQNKYPAISEVNYGGLVDLIALHEKQVAW